MKKITLFYLMLTLSFFKCQTKPMEATIPPGYLTESQLFEFYSHYWLNLHHFLYNKADVYTKKSIEETITTAVWEQMKVSEKETFIAALAFYRDNLIEEDLRTGDYHYTFKNWVIQQKGNANLPNNSAFDSHINILNKVHTNYTKYWWRKHQEKNLQVLEDNRALIEKLEGNAKNELAQLTKSEWQAEKIRVDICYFAKLGRPYTSTNPTHIVMNVGRNAKPAGNWFELLFHEASHHFIFPISGFVGETIKQAEVELEIKAPRGLWHGYLFYFTGKVSQDLLIKEGIKDYELYMVRRKVFARFYPLLDQHLPAYLKGKISLLECTKKIITDFEEANNK